MIQQFFLENDQKGLSVVTFEVDGVSRWTLFIPGFGQPKYEIDYLYPYIAKKLYNNHLSSSFLFDFYGCGDSLGEFETVSYDSMWNDLLSVYTWLDAQGVREIDLVASGIGAVLAEELVKIVPDRVRKLIYLSPYLPIPAIPVCFEEEYVYFYDLLKDVHFATYSDYTIPQIRFLANLGSYMENLKGMRIRSENFRDLLQIECNYQGTLHPRLWICGEKDPRLAYLPRLEEQSDLKLIANGTIHFQDAYCREELFQRVLDWLGEEKSEKIG